MLTHPLESLSFVRRHAKLRLRYRRPRVQDFPGNPRRPSLRTLRALEMLDPHEASLTRHVLDLAPKGNSSPISPGSR